MFLLTEDEYVPKLIPINWSDPRSNSEFMKELEDLMNCDAYAFNSSGCSLPAELDSMAENISLPTLPRNITQMLSATDEELADWEYSIKVEKGEATDNEDESVCSYHISYHIIHIIFQAYSK